MTEYNHIITVVQTKIFQLEIKSNDCEIDAMTYAMDLMNSADKGDNDYLIKESMTWDHYFSQEDYTQSCLQCGAKNHEEAESKCLGSSDQDHCHGCELWPND